MERNTMEVMDFAYVRRVNPKSDKSDKCLVHALDPEGRVLYLSSKGLTPAGGGAEPRQLAAEILYHERCEWSS